MSEHGRDAQPAGSPTLVHPFPREDRPGQSSSGSQYVPYQDAHAGPFSSHLDSLRTSPWDPQPSYPGSSSRQGPLLPPPNPPSNGHAFDGPAAPSHQAFLFDMMNRSPSTFLPQQQPPSTSSPQYGVPGLLPPPPPPLYPDSRRDHHDNPHRPTYEHKYSAGQTEPQGSVSPPSSTSDRSGRGSGSYSVPQGGAGFGSMNGQQPESYYSPTHLHGGTFPPTAPPTALYYNNQFGAASASHNYPYPPYSQSHPLPPPSNMVNNALPYPFHFSSHGQVSPQSSFATPALWSSSFPRDGTTHRPFSAPTPPPHHQHLVYDSDHHGSSSSGLPSRSRRSESGPSSWDTMGGDPTASSSSSHPHSARHQPYGRPSPRASSESVVSRGKRRSSGGGRKKLPVEATDALLNFYLKPDGKYPSREQKLEWERTTGLTLQQVEDWFINKRRRIKTSTAAAEGQARKRSS